MADTPVLELESLFVRIYSDASSLIKTAVEVETAVDLIEKRLVAFSQNLATTAASGMTVFSKSLANVGWFLAAVSKADLDKIEQAITPINTFTTSLASMAAGLGSSMPGFRQATLGLQRIGTFIRAITKMDFGVFIDHSWVFTEAMKEMIGGLAAIDVAKMDPVLKVLTKLGGFMRAIPKIDPAGMKAFSQFTMNLVNSLGSLPAEAINNVNKIGNAMRGMAKLALATGGGGFPAIHTNLNLVSQQAQQATRSVNSLSGRFRAFTQSVSGSNTALTAFRFSLAAVAGYGIYLFAKFDDLLTRTMAHMRDWGQQSRGTLEAGIFGTAATSRTGLTDLAKGMDVLASSGMNAAMAAKALGIAETFSVASGMEMEGATKKLVDILRSLGLQSNEAKQQYAEMVHLSDLLVGIAPMVGSTTQELADSFGNRFTVAVQHANMSMEEAIALQGAYSLRAIRGSEASDRAARFLMEINKESIENIFRWKALGIEVYDASGKMNNVADIIKQLDGRLGGMSYQMQEATLRTLGFENRAIAAILPLLGMSDAMKTLQDEAVKTAGIAEKTADMLRHSFIGQLKILWNQISLVAEEIGNALAPIIGWLAQQIGSLFRWFMMLNPEVRRFVIIVGAALVLIGPILSLLGSIAGVLTGSVIGAFTTLWGIITGIGSAIGTVVAALGAMGGWLLVVIPAAVAAFALLAGGVAGLAKWISDMDVTWDSLRDGTQRFFKDLAGFFNNFQENLNIIWRYIQDNWRTLLSDMSTLAIAFVKNSLANFMVMLQVVGKLFKLLFLDWLAENWKTLLEDFFNLTVVALGELLRLYLDFLLFLKDIFEIAILGIINLLVNKFWMIVPGIMLVFVFLIGELFVLWKKFTQAMGDALLNALKGKGSEIWDGIVEDIKKSFSEEELNKKMAKIGSEGIMAAMVEAFDKFKGRAEERGKGLLSAFQFKTPGIDQHFIDKQDEVKDILKTGFAALKTPFAGVVLQTKVLPELKLAIEESNRLTGEEEKMRLKAFKPHMEGEGEGQIPGRGGPGFTFKQISAARFVVGGSAAETLDYQQLVSLRAIDNKLGNLIIVARGLATKFGFIPVLAK